MVIEKNGNRYLVKENLNSWSISEKNGKFEILYNVPKEVCETVEDLEKYIIENDNF